MTKQSKKEYLNELRSRYLAASKQERTVMLDEIIIVCRFHRKYLIKVLNKKPYPVYPKALYGAIKKKRGRQTIYDAPGILPFLERLWHATNQACSKRLKGLIPLWLPKYTEATKIVLTLECQALIVRMSHSTIDRLLYDIRQPYRIGKGRCTTKPGTLLKKRIPIQTGQWKEKRPGFLEVDTVAHCGTSMTGQFVFSLNIVDLGSSWTQARAVWGKGETGVLKAFRSIEAGLPFPLRGFDSDNGGEFINHHIDKYLQGRHRQVKQTRSREYESNDNAHIEQKNWTHIRQTFGYERFDNPQVVELMNDLYANEFSLLMNFFLPSVKLQKKFQLGSKWIKHHDTPRTPCQRLLASRFISEETKRSLREQEQALNPFLLHETIQRKVKAILGMCSLRPPSPVLPSPVNALPNKQKKDKFISSLPGSSAATPTGGTPGLSTTIKFKKKINDGN